MRGKKKKSACKSEQGIIITLVAVFMLGVIGAMAALSIDVVTLYTARSEAQLSADSAALAAARVIANSGATSDTTGTLNLLNAVEASPGPAQSIALQVAEQNQIAGSTLTAAQVTVTFGGTNLPANPTVKVTIQKNDLPTFFARIWGRTQFAVAATATAEAYNPSILQGTGAGPGIPIAPTCVKPWLLPNMSPTSGAGKPIFTAASGAIADTTLLGWQTPTAPGPTSYKLRTDCTTNCATTPAPQTWRYYPGTTDPAGDFPAPSSTSCTGCAGYTPYELSIAGCVQTPVACNDIVHVDTTRYPTRDTQTGTAVNSLIHSTGNGGDTVDTALNSPPSGSDPFQFLPGSENPDVLSGPLASSDIITVSDSLVTVPVIDTTTAWPPKSTIFPSVQIIGFVQLFLSPDGTTVPFNGHVTTRVINLVGCGDGTGGAAGQQIIGNGGSPVAVRLITP